MKEVYRAISVIPEDLALVILLTVLCIPFVLIPPLNETPVRIILGLPLVLFLPGYSLIALLFPRRADLDVLERIALGFGLSIALVPLLGLALNYTPFGIRLSPILAVLTLVTVSFALGAVVRRRMIPEAERFEVSFAAAFEQLRASFSAEGVPHRRERLPKPKRFILDFSPFVQDLKKKFKRTGPQIDRILSVILISAIVVAIAMVIYVLVTPKQGEQFTEFYILGPGGMASDYPTNLKIGEVGEVIIGVVNHEYAPVAYHLEVKLGGEVIRAERIELEHNETWERPFTFSAERAGADQKLEFLLFKGGLEETEEREEPYRTLHLWVDVHG
ncbi:MAG: DUF1616 domain-containing protein [Methanophagales archaeon ANME-1-THS]|nr:MAG: DUF1616 domain-containing protein [Methanophagales archaeon ANME-1-THS]